MLEIIGTIATALAVTGVILNNYRKRSCFILWLISNSMFAAIHLHLSVYSLTARDIIFIALAIHGWILWRTKCHK